jgi:tetratricopeptide (TPR) repeat protein
MPRTGEPEEKQTLLELKRICTSRVFTNHLKLAEFLDVLVKAELTHKELSEHELGVIVFGKPGVWNPIYEGVVRENTRRLRKHLQEYYLREGADDLVVIELPKGRGRRPRFFFNPHVHAADRHEEIIRSWNEVFPVMEDVPERLIAQLQKCIDKTPSYAPAYSTLARMLLTYATLNDGGGAEIRAAMRRAEKNIAKCLRLNDQLWQAHATLGALLCCRFRWAEAGAAFKRALMLGGNEARTDIWYMSFLAAVGEIERMEECIRLRHQMVRGDRFAPMIKGLLYYVCRVKGAWGELERLGKAGLGSNTIGDGHRGPRIIGDNWIVDILMACIVLGSEGGGPTLSYWAACFAEGGTIKSKVHAFYGLHVYAYSLSGKDRPKDFTRRAEWASEFMSWRQGSVGLALCYLAIGKRREAIGQLRKACDDGNPLMGFLHLWPIFDELRELAEFKRLVEKMKLPASALRAAAALRTVE